MIGDGMPKLLERSFAARGVDVSDEEFQRYFEAFRDFYIANCSVDTKTYPGAVEMLNQVREAGYLTAICTNKLETITNVILDDMDLTGLFDGVVGAEPPRAKKPEADPLWLAIERAGGTQDNAIMIGDSATDIGAGKAANLPTIAVSFGYTNIPPAELGADILVDKLIDVVGAAQELMSG